MAMTFLPLVLVPGLLCSARLFAPQIAALWPFGQIAVADHRRDAEISAIAARILADAPPRFALAGLSMGVYIAFAMLRQAPGRIAKLALLDTSARRDTAEQSAGRERFITMAQAGKLSDVADILTQRFLHRNRQNDETLKRVIQDMILSPKQLCSAFRASFFAFSKAGAYREHRIQLSGSA